MSFCSSCTNYIEYPLRFILNLMSFSVFFLVFLNYLWKTHTVVENFVVFSTTVFIPLRLPQRH
jgi:hypothetical protein